MRNLLAKILGKIFNLISIFSAGFAANKAMLLFSKPRKKRMSESQRDFLNTSFIEELSLNGLSIMSYRWLGKNDPVLLLHGWESNASRWQTLVKKLNKKGHCVIAIDAPAHGKSGSNRFNTVLYAEFINIAVKRFKPTIIIGHSMGAMSAVISINKFKMQTIEKIILLGAPSEFTDVFKRYTDMMGYNSRIIKKSKSVIIERYGKTPEEFSTSKFLADLNFKGLIIHDEDDNVIPYQDALRIKESFKNSTLITTKGLGHSLTHDTVEDHISDFIETT